MSLGSSIVIEFKILKEAQRNGDFEQIDASIELIAEFFSFFVIAIIGLPIGSALGVYITTVSQMSNQGAFFVLMLFAMGTPVLGYFLTKRRLNGFFEKVLKKKYKN